ncbi:MAG: response regulator, partial [Tepidisphaeraceae bacterium]
VRPEKVRISDVIGSLKRTFEPVSTQKGVAFATHVEQDAPETMVTDSQRLEQVLKNLLSNALKFTEKGSVTISVRKSGEGRIAFAVRDTGIGIAPHQQGMIFEAFRQADGTTNRKYGGTGLGLSISRELMRLLGGEISLESEPGKGSIFTVTLPLTYTPAAATSQRPAPVPGLSAGMGALSMHDEAPAPRAAARPSATRRVEDDRERLTGNGRVILVIEDDEPFARILYDLAKELNFQCLIALTAEDGQIMAIQYTPSAIVLDMGLPDRSGLSVLDKLKRDPRTRHIPVHVVSANDYAQAAMSLGAIGYMLKPVKREELAEAFEQLETRLTQKMRRVLVVEDDAVQLESLQRLLGSRDVETVGVRSAAECLESLRQTTFDCMVLDLSLPDASGFSLLETLSQGENYSFPPVIVYTGRDLTADEEQQLGRYSKSIIIKGAKSPERLLDEVTLFLHQVVAELPADKQKMLEKARSRDSTLEGRTILVVEDDIRNVYALTSLLEPEGVTVRIARNGREALLALEAATQGNRLAVDLVLMDIMMPEMDGLTAMREVRKRPEWKKLPIIALTAKAMKDDQEQCVSAGASDYMAKPLDVEKLLSLVRVWMPR